MRYWIYLALVVLPLLLEYVRLGRWRGAVPIRVHVHGTRGKTTVTRTLAALLRSRGFRVLAKTTGDAPEYVLPDGNMRPIRRWGPPRIQEHVDVLRMAARLRAEIVVVEGMAIQRETVFQSERILCATHAIVTNLRPDHQETMGVGRRGVLDTLSLMFPRRGVIYTAAETGARILSARAAAADVPCKVVSVTSLREQAGELAAAVANGIAAGRPQQDCSSRDDDRPPGRLHAAMKTIVSRDVTLRLVDLFSANDVVSARLSWHGFVSGLGSDCLRIALLATRSDRPLRTRAFLDWLSVEPEFDFVAPVGGHAWYACLRASRRGRDARRRLLTVANPWTGPEHVLERLQDIARRRGQSEIAIIGLGNTHEFGMRWRTMVSHLEPT
jgi:hypothetical protein